MQKFNFQDLIDIVRRDLGDEDKTLYSDREIVEYLNEGLRDYIQHSKSLRVSAEIPFKADQNIYSFPDNLLEPILFEDKDGNQITEQSSEWLRKQYGNDFMSKTASRPLHYFRDLDSENNFRFYPSPDANVPPTTFEGGCIFPFYNFFTAGDDSQDGIVTFGIFEGILFIITHTKIFKYQINNDGLGLTLLDSFSHGKTISSKFTDEISWNAYFQNPKNFQVDEERRPGTLLFHDGKDDKIYILQSGTQIFIELVVFNLLIHTNDNLQLIIGTNQDNGDVVFFMGRNISTGDVLVGRQAIDGSITTYIHTAEDADVDSENIGPWGFFDYDINREDNLFYFCVTATTSGTGLYQVSMASPYTKTTITTNTVKGVSYTNGALYFNDVTEGKVKKWDGSEITETNISYTGGNYMVTTDKGFIVRDTSVSNWSLSHINVTTEETIEVFYQMMFEAYNRGAVKEFHKANSWYHNGRLYMKTDTVLGYMQYCLFVSSVDHGVLRYTDGTGFSSEFGGLVKASTSSNKMHSFNQENGGVVAHYDDSEHATLFYAREPTDDTVEISEPMALVNYAKYRCLQKNGSRQDENRASIFFGLYRRLRGINISRRNNRTVGSQPIYY